MRGVLASLCVLGALLSATVVRADPPPRSLALRDADDAAHSASLAGQRLLRLLDDARLARDARRTSCVDGKLTQVNSFARMILDRRERLYAAANRREAEHLRLVIRSLRAQLRQLEREGVACSHGPGETTVTVVRS